MIRAFWTVSSVGADTTYCIVLHLTWKNIYNSSKYIVSIASVGTLGGSCFSGCAPVCTGTVVQTSLFSLTHSLTLVEVCPAYSMGQNGGDIETITSSSPFIHACFGEMYTPKVYTRNSSCTRTRTVKDYYLPFTACSASDMVTGFLYH